MGGWGGSLSDSFSIAKELIGSLRSVKPMTTEIVHLQPQPTSLHFGSLFASSDVWGLCRGAGVQGAPFGPKHMGCWRRVPEKPLSNDRAHPSTSPPKKNENVKNNCKFYFLL